MRTAKYAVALLGLAAVLMLCAVTPAVAELVPLSGAIWTTTGQGEKVNANHYDQKCPPTEGDPCVSPPLVPFLNGGPSFASPRKWVPDGMYYFQVTDPSGKTLLSSDSIESRRFRVWTDSEDLKHVEYPVPGYPSPDPFHLTCNDFESGNITIALCPFDDTPNNGGVYKLWITPVEAYQEYGDFIGRYSKTDNFKVKKLASIYGDKVDTDGSPVENVCIILYKETKLKGVTSWQEMDRTCTNGVGEFGFTGLSEGKYKVEEDLTCTDCGGSYSDCTQVSPDGPIYFTLTRADMGGRGKNAAPGTPIDIGGFVNECGPPPEATLAGRKFLDEDGDGCWDDAVERPLAGWTICFEQKDGNGDWVPVLDANDDPLCVVTGAAGDYSVPGLPVPMTYRISETLLTGWAQTGPNLDTDEECLYGPPGCSDPCSSIQVSPTDADVTVVAKEGKYIVNFGEAADVLTEVGGLNFGNELASICVEKKEACSGRSLSGLTFTLWDCACEVPVTEDALGNPIEPIVTGGDDDDCWHNLLAGSYCVKETPAPGWDCVGPMEQCKTVAAGETATVCFTNWAPCMGLTPGYWKNWRNHYTDEQFCELTYGTIADVIGPCAAHIWEADDIFEHWDASPGDELTILKAFLLANQLTLNLTQHPELPNPSDGSLVGDCTLVYDGTTIVLSDAIAEALACLSDSCSREDLLRIKNWLAAFANARYSTCPCVPGIAPTTVRDRLSP